jgi:hypothetical protein
VKKVLSFLIACVTSIGAFAQEQLVSSWLVTVDNGDGKTFQRVLIVKSVKQGNGPEFVPDLLYGLTTGQSAVTGTVTKKESGVYVLQFVTQAKSKVEATQNADGSFTGTFVDPTGASKPLRMEKISKASVAALKFPPPAADVPQACAAFYGGWAGEWSISQGPVRLWVHAITADCSAMYSYRSTDSDDAPYEYRKIEIKDGKLAIPCGNGGTCVFTHQGNELWASYQSTSGTNNGVFRSIR